MTHARHQLLGARSRCRRKGVSGVAQIMKVEAGEPRLLRRLVPVAVEGLAVKRLPDGAAEHKTVGSWRRVRSEVLLKIGNEDLGDGDRPSPSVGLGRSEHQLAR